MIASRRYAMIVDIPRFNYEICKYYYEYLKKRLDNMNALYPNMKDRTLSLRNLACLRAVIYAMDKCDETAYWHELADFIENYNSVAPVSYDECWIFCILFEVKNNNEWR